MKSTLEFTKMHGAGNDYIYVDTTRFPIAHPEAFAKTWSAPHTGIGSDGLVLIGSSTVADFSMRIFNADGSEAMMCGNASRCIGKYVYEKGLTRHTHLTLETLSGIKDLDLTVKDGKVTRVTVDMGIPLVDTIETPITIDGSTYFGYEVSMGNPHFVIFVDKLETLDISHIGRTIEYHPMFFPERTNVEFVQITSSRTVRMRVWERGSGITQACGTGACATVVAGIASAKLQGPTEVVMDGGKLKIDWKNEQHVLMTGEAVTVFQGTLEYDA